MNHPLSPNERRARAISLVILPIAFVAGAILPPVSLPSWFPLPTSCGAITGLPCIFCGLTRAMHHLLHGDWRGALYYNWLAFPLLAGALAVISLCAVELLLQRKLLPLAPRIHLTRRAVAVCAVGLMLLWCLQAYLAVSQHKTELLNPAGPLYSLVVR